MGRFWNVDVGFKNNDDEDDETEFSISAYVINELESLFEDFCNNYEFPNDTATYVCVVKTADDESELN